jgi:autotransporter-associated beta strand protein
MRIGTGQFHDPGGVRRVGASLEGVLVMTDLSPRAMSLVGTALVPFTLLVSTPALADCLPNAQGTIVTCNANDPDGFLAGDGVTIAVSPGATVDGPLGVGLAGRINNEGIVGNTGLSALTAGGGSTVVNTRIATVNGTLDYGATGAGVVNLLDNRGLFNASVTSLGALDLSNTFAGLEVGTIIGNISSVGPSRIVNSGAAALIEGTITLGAGDDSISNSGVILGDIALGGGAGTVTNAATGQITGNLTAGGNTTISNAGTFTGNIALGAGNDTITNTGLIDGNIDMGAGTNVIGFGSSAAQPTGTLTADAAGTNTLNLFGAGADTLDIEVTNFDVLNKDGTGSWELTRAVALSDRININQGALIASDADWLAGNRIVNNASLVFSNLSDGVFAGAIEGSGAVTVGGAGAAITTLSGANVYTGGTTIAEGTLRVTGGAALLYTGAVVVQAPGTLDVAAAETIGDLTGDGLVTLSGGALSVNSGAFAGSITGANGLTKVGAGTLTLSGVNDFAGPATVAGGTLVLEGGAAIADTTDVAVAAGATLSVMAAEGFGSLTGDGAVVLTAGVTVGLDDGSSTFAGVISGAGSLTKAGTGTLTLTGANSYSGGTIVDGGTLAGAAGPIQGDVLVNAAGTLRFEQAVAGTYAGALSGDGVVTKAGAGVLTLTGTNAGHAGQFNLDGGAVSIASEANLGTGVLAFSGATLITTGPTVLLNDVTLSAAGGSFETRDLTALAGVISGPGGLTKTGAGTLLLVGANSYAGGTTVSAGTLAGDTISLQGAIAVLGGATVAFAQGADGTYAGAAFGGGHAGEIGRGHVNACGGEWRPQRADQPRCGGDLDRGGFQPWHGHGAHGRRDAGDDGGDDACERVHAGTGGRDLPGGCRHGAFGRGFGRGRADEDRARRADAGRGEQLYRGGDGDRGDAAGDGRRRTCGRWFRGGAGAGHIGRGGRRDHRGPDGRRAGDAFGGRAFREQRGVCGLDHRGQRADQAGCGHADAFGCERFCRRCDGFGRNAGAGQRGGDRRQHRCGGGGRGDASGCRGRRLRRPFGRRLCGAG